MPNFYLFRDIYAKNGVTSIFLAGFKINFSIPLISILLWYIKLALIVISFNGL